MITIMCEVCKGTGLVSIGDGIRGVKKCNKCNGKGFIKLPIKNKEKSLYVVKFNDNTYYDGMGHTTTQLKNAKIYSSEKYANEAGDKMIRKDSILISYKLVKVELKEIE